MKVLTLQQSKQVEDAKNSFLYITGIGTLTFSIKLGNDGKHSLEAAIADY